MKHIKSPLNYTGNKFRILSQIERYFPEKTEVFVDLFCGGATVGFNVSAKKIVLIDNNKRIIELLKMLANSKIDFIINRIEFLINEYSLSYSAKYGYKEYSKTKDKKDNNGLKDYNYTGFYKLRTDYNNLKNKFSKKALIMLYVLMVYSFNNDIRFNGKGEFNLPVGKTDFNKNNYQKIIEFNKRAKEINYEFVCSSFTSNKTKRYIEEATFIYMDPPYLITDAVYNESNNWNIMHEKKLMKLVSYMYNTGKRFALSNVINKEGKNNDVLSNWLKDKKNIKVIDIDYHYRSSSYNKINRNANEKEVLVVNKD